jgi:ubiquinone/menaquinone biosynthesis C-methylase UbiE
MAAVAPLRHGDFTGLAADYAKYRPGYAAPVLAAVKGLLGRPAESVEVVDVGAGTGLWTRMLADAGFRRVTAVEPNDDMRAAGEQDPTGYEITWRAGSGEATGLPAHSVDLVTMASSFHWVHFERGLAEFHRVLRPNGWFVALWNPRLVEANPLLVDIEAELTRLRPDLRRVSSGRSGITETLAERLHAHPCFTDVLMIEGRHVERQSVHQYLGVWRSVNDVRVQLGERDFERFLRYAENRLAGVTELDTTYLTRAWAARRA